MNELEPKEKQVRNKLSGVEAIRLYYQTQEDRHPVHLTEKQEEQRQRLVAAHALVLQKGSQESAIRILAKRFKISEMQARRDIRDAISLFGDVMKSDRDGMRYLLYEKSMMIFQQAQQKGDIKGMNNALKTAVTLMGLDREDPDLPDFGKIAPSVNLLLLPEEIQDGINSLLKLGAINLTNKTIDVDHEVLE